MLRGSPWEAMRCDHTVVPVCSSLNPELLGDEHELSALRKFSLSTQVDEAGLGLTSNCRSYSFPSNEQQQLPAS